MAMVALVIVEGAPDQVAVVIGTTAADQDSHSISARKPSWPCLSDKQINRYSNEVSAEASSEGPSVLRYFLAAQEGEAPLRPRLKSSCAAASERNPLRCSNLHLRAVEPPHIG